MLKLLQARLQQYMNWELPDVQGGFRKDSGTRDQIANIHWIIEKAGEFQRNIYFCFIDYAKAFDCVDHNKLQKILKEMWKLDHHVNSAAVNTGVHVSLSIPVSLLWMPSSGIAGLYGSSVHMPVK